VELRHDEYLSPEAERRLRERAAGGGA